MNNIGLLALLGIGAYMLYKNSGPQLTETEKAWIERMKANPEWLAAEVQKAAERGISLEEMLIIEAKWMIEQGWQL